MLNEAGPNPALIPSGPSQSSLSRPIGFDQGQGIPRHRLWDEMADALLHMDFPRFDRAMKQLRNQERISNER